MSAQSQNGWPALSSSSSLLYTWSIPTKAGVVRLRLRNGSAGFLLCHMLLWIADVIEPLVGAVLDDWGYADRLVRGSETTLSNHASGTAADANATRHPLGRVGTWVQAARIRLRLKLYAGAIRWGGDYHGRVDEMHFEINVPLAPVEKVARRLMKTPRGRKILAANPSQRAVILS